VDLLKLFLIALVIAIIAIWLKMSFEGVKEYAETVFG
jgi:hypothetical protein